MAEVHLARHSPAPHRSLLDAPRRALGSVLLRWTRPQLFLARSKPDSPRPVLYVLEHASLADRALIEALFQHDRLTPGEIIALREDPLTPRVPDALARLIQARTSSGTDLELWPVNVFWGRTPEREASETARRWRWLRVWAAEGWGERSLLRKLLAIVFFRRDVVVQCASPIDLAVELERAAAEGLDGERQSLRLARLCRAALRRDREALLGPDLSHRRTLLDAILREPRVQAAIAEEAARRGTKPQAIEKRALAYAREIAADDSYLVVRVMDRLLGWLWQRFYDGVQLQGLDRLTALAREHTLVYVPCHRSHVDYLLLSYVVHKAGLRVPHIAAGENLNMPLIGPILRGGGAFFMRRSFKDDLLYAEVFAAYLHEVLKRGFPIEYFVEGGRSRTGRMLPPKAGLISMTVQSHLRAHERPLLFMPVYIGYEKLIEGGSYTEELSGRAKRKESLWGLLGSLREMRRQRYGAVSVSFAEPLVLDELLAEYQVGTMDDWLTSKDLRRRVLTELSRRIAVAIQGAVHVNAVAIIAAGVLATPRHAAELEQLANYHDRLRALLARSASTREASFTELSGIAAIEHTLAMGYLRRQQHVFGDIVQAPEAAAVLLTYFRNNIQHLLALPGLILCLVTQHGSLGRVKLTSLVSELYRVLAIEFYLPLPPQARESWPAFESTLAALLDAGWLMSDAEAMVLSTHPPSSLVAQHGEWLAAGIRPALVRYALILGVIVRDPRARAERRTIEEMAQQAAQHLAITHVFNAPEFSDRTQFRLALDAFVQAGVVREPEPGMIERVEATQRLAEIASFLLPPDTQAAVSRAAERQATRIDTQ